MDDMISSIRDPDRVCADLEKLKAAFRTSLADNFGDYAAGLALSSFQGMDGLVNQTCCILRAAFPGPACKSNVSFCLAAKYYNPLTQLCVIRCRREQHKEVRISPCILRRACACIGKLTSDLPLHLNYLFVLVFRL